MIIVLSLTLFSCGAKVEWLKMEEERINPTSLVTPEDAPLFADDMDLVSLKEAAEHNTSLLRSGRIAGGVKFGDDNYQSTDIAESVNLLIQIFEKTQDSGERDKLIKQKFNIYRSAGRDGKGGMLFTGYYTPTYRGSFVKTDVYKYPLYSKPSDVATRNPYYTRGEIDGQGVLNGKGLEVAWMENDLDRFFLQVQGSGVLAQENGKGIMVTYGGTNGHEYVSIGKVLINEKKIPEAEVSMQSIREYLTKHPEDIRHVFDQNQRYIFFEANEIPTAADVQNALTPGRSVAADLQFFPKGLLAFLKTERPEVNDKNELTQWKPFSRFVFVQDTGSAIKSPGRIDIYWGASRYAEVAAGNLKHPGELYFLVKKP